MGLGLAIITTADTTPETNRPPPHNAAIAKDMPPAELPAADKDAMTSGAPFPIAKSVTPAKDSDIPKVEATFSSAGDKNASAVDPKM